MLHCTACRKGLSPFALHRPYVDKICPTCGAELRIHRRGRHAQEVEGPALPPVPPGVEVERSPASHGSYREQPEQATLWLRWRDPIAGVEVAQLAGAGLTTAAGVVAAAAIHPLALVVSFPGVTYFTSIRSWPRAGELTLGATSLSIRLGRLSRSQSWPRKKLEAVAVVEEDDPQKGRIASRVSVRLATGEWRRVAQPRSGPIAHYLGASLRVALGADVE